jgi:hypothetical protein
MHPDMACRGLFGILAYLRDLDRRVFNQHHSHPRAKRGNPKQPWVAASLRSSRVTIPILCIKL